MFIIDIISQQNELGLILYTEMRDIKNIKPLKFLISGGLAAITEYILFIVLVLWISLDPVIAQPISFSAGLVTSYGLNRAWVFGTNKRIFGEFIKYGILAVINLFVGTVLIVLLDSIGLQVLIAKIAVMVLIASWNYIIFNKYIFK